MSTPVSSDRLLKRQLDLALAAAEAGRWQCLGDTIEPDDALRVLLGRPTPFPDTLARWTAQIDPASQDAFRRAVDDLRSGKTDTVTLTYHFQPDASHSLLLEHRLSAVPGEVLNASDPVLLGVIRNLTRQRQEKTRLEDERSQLRTLIRTIPDMIWLKALDGSYLDLNEPAAELFGRKPDDVIGLTDHDLLPHALADLLREADQRCASDDETLSFEEWLSFPDGRRELFETTKTLVRGKDGSPIGVMGIAHNITPYRQATETLHRQNRTLHLLSGIAHALNRHQEEASMLDEICLLAVETGGYHLAWIGMLNHDTDNSVSIVAHSGVGEDYLNTLQVSWGDNEYGQGPTGRSIRSGLPVVCRDIENDRAYDLWRERAQRYGYRSSIAMPIRVDGQVVGALNLYAATLSAFDETEIGMLEDLAGEIGFGLSILRSRQALTRSQEELSKLKLAIEQSPHSIVITNTRAQIEFVNEAFVQNTGYRREEALGRNPNMLHSGQTPQATYIAMWSAMERGEIWRGEFINRRKDGSLYNEFAIISPVRQADGGITHYLAIKEDITEKKRIAEELERHRHDLETLVQERTGELIVARDEAEAASRAKSAFLANMSHEIRTPLNAIIGLTHLAQRDALSEEQSTRLGKIGGAAKHLLALINDVLDVSKIEAEKLVLEETEFSPGDVVDAARVLVHDRADAKSLPIHVRIDPGLPPHLIGDPLRIQQILVNFLSNAVKFTESGEIAVSVEMMERSHEALTLRFSVRDTGIGISEEVKSRLFAPFEQADTSTTRRYGGTGLGLAISRRLATAMQGRVGVHSLPGEGSTFWFTGRFRIGAAPATPAIPAVKISAEAELTARFSSARILLAEDNPVNQEVASELLRGVGMQVDIARHGAEATVMLTKAPYDLILMDMQMPVLDGLEATRLIRAMPQGAEIPIIAMTANAFEEDRRKCFAAGMNDHVGKPVDPDTLFSTLLRWLPAGKAATPTESAVSTQPTHVPQAMPMENDDQARITALEAIPGLDAQFGLKSVRGRLASYLRLLGKLMDSHGDDFAQIRTQLAEGHEEEARRLAHSMKGAAGSLGATALQQAAAALEQSIKEQAPIARINPLIDALATEYQRLGSALAPYLVAETTDPGVTPAQRLRPLLAKLHQLLSDGDMSAQTLVREQRNALTTLFDSDFKRFEDLIGNFDFERALTLLQRYRSQLDSSPPH